MPNAYNLRSRSSDSLRFVAEEVNNYYCDSLDALRVIGLGSLEFGSQ